jgi:hypothetical protein
MVSGRPVRGKRPMMQGCKAGEEKGDQAIRESMRRVEGYGEDDISPNLWGLLVNYN